MTFISLTKIALLITVLSSFSTVSTQTYIGKRELHRDYYAINIPSDNGKESAQYIASKLGVRFEGNVGELDHWFMLSSPKNKAHIEKRDQVLTDFEHHKAQSLLNKRDENQHHWHLVKRLDKQVLKKRTKRAPIPTLNATQLLLDTQKDLHIKDPLFPKQWHLINQETPGNDINVTGVWKQGIAGKGVNVVILDDGLDYTSKDLADNFFAEGSYDFNDHEDLPTPKLWDDNHGTRCAGQIAAVRNDACGMGIAYESKVAGVRILSGELTDADEALALNYKYQKNHIFSCSWGPPDNGQTMEAPNGILADAFVNGIKKGRDGKGTIYVFATGNGAISGDNCNFDGYTNSIYTITVGAIDHSNNHPAYSESCSAQLVVTYSSGGGEYIYTTDRGKNSCADSHGGTSAAAPNAAGIFALVLSVRPDLSWRDLQHLCVQNAIPINLDDDDWKKLPSGRIYNHKYGYGKLDAYKLVEAAKTFESVNQQTWLELPSPVKKRRIPDSTGLKTKKALKSTVLVTEDMIKAAGLLRLEHITATVDIAHQRRGNIVIDLVSPNHVTSHIATRRGMDTDPNGIKNWKFMTVKHWEENPLGNWTLNVYDVDNPESTGYLMNWTLTLFGEQDPAFKGTPIHTSTSIHEDDEHEVSISSTTTKATTTSDNTPTRPTRVKPNTTKSKETIVTTKTESKATPSSDTHNDAITSEKEEETEAQPDAQTKEDDRGYLTIVYSVVGSIAILGVATALYFYKRHGWKSPSTITANRPSGYEFDVIQPLTELDENELSESDSDAEEIDRLVRNPH